MLRAPPLHAAPLFAIWRESAQGAGLALVVLASGCAELFSQLPSSERSCQYNRLPYRRDRDGRSTRKLGIGVFIHPGPVTDMGAPQDIFRSPRPEIFQLSILDIYNDLIPG